MFYLIYLILHAYIISFVVVFAWVYCGLRLGISHPDFWQLFPQWMRKKGA